MNMESPLYQKMTCWKGYTAKGTKNSPSGKKDSSGNIMRVNNCVENSNGPKQTKEFKTHKMYGPDGDVLTAKTMKKHLALKKKGYGHTKKK